MTPVEILFTVLCVSSIWVAFVFWIAHFLTPRLLDGEDEPTPKKLVR